MKHYSFQTAPWNYKNSNSYFDNKEWRKHILNLEKKVDALWTYLNWTKPNYTTINWNKDNELTEDIFMIIKDDDYTSGAIYRYKKNDYEYRDYYFLKSFDNNSLIWGRKNVRFINDEPSAYWINQIKNIWSSFNAGDFIDYDGDKTISIKPPENSWLLIDKNKEKGYDFLPSTSGYGGAYTLKWMCESGQYFIQSNLINNGKDISIKFFNNPFQVRWNTYSDTNNIKNVKYIRTNNDDIITTQGEFYQGQKQLMYSFYKKTDNIDTIDYERVFADCDYQNNEEQSYQQIDLKIDNTINMGVYYW